MVDRLLRNRNNLNAVAEQLIMKVSSKLIAYQQNPGKLKAKIHTKNESGTIPWLSNFWSFTMNLTEATALLEFCRKRTLSFLDAITKLPTPQAVLGWRPGPGRAHIGWQLMHIGATDDRHLGGRMVPGEPVEPANTARFGNGSTPDDNIPSVDEIRRYLGERRAAVLGHLAIVKDWTAKPQETSPWPYEDWVRVLAWHEAHHQGQAHLTLNLYKAAHPSS